MIRPGLALCLLAMTAFPAAADGDAGAAAYARVCADCHGPAGRGDVAPTLVPLPYDADYVLAIVREGYIEMPPISKREISDDEVRQVAAYLQSLGGEPDVPTTESLVGRVATTRASASPGSRPRGPRASDG